MSDLRNWGAQFEDKWKQEKEELCEKITEALKKYSKEDLELIAFAIKRDSIKEDYIEYKKLAEGKVVPKSIKRLGCYESDILEFIKHKKVFRF